MGSVDGLLRGRPTSWEADLIHQLITGAAAEEDLPARRTEPVRVPLDIDEQWDRFGLADLAQEAFDEINGRMLEVDDESPPESDALADEQLAVDELEDSDRAAYISAFTVTARQIAQEHGITAPPSRSSPAHTSMTSRPTSRMISKSASATPLSSALCTRSPTATPQR